MSRNLILLCALVLASTLGVAQNDTPFAIWTDFNPSYKISERWKIGGDIGYRIAPSTSDQTVYLRPTITYIPGNVISFITGIASFNHYNPDSYSSTELRTFQFVVVLWPRIIEFQFKHRLGLEQRWFYIPELGLADFVSRVRYYLELRSPKFNLFSISSPFYALTNFEILRDLDDEKLGRLIDHNRYTFGIGNHVSDRFQVDIRYKLINFLDPTLNTFISNLNVIRIRFYYKISPPGSKNIEK